MRHYASSWISKCCAMAGMSATKIVGVQRTMQYLTGKVAHSKLSHSPAVECARMEWGADVCCGRPLRSGGSG